ncbi:MAG: glycosyltransferase family 9 protein [Planctomycetota bacterium]|nr:glycosyltransferase family 9 protein [Planctomycetota bacterium]
MREIGQELGTGGARRVLLVRYGRMGENLFWTSLPDALRAANPDRQVLVLTNQPSLWNSHPGVEEVLSFPLGITKKSGPDKMVSLLKILQEKKLDAIVVGKEPRGIHEMLEQVGVPHYLDPEKLSSAGPSPAIPSTHNPGSLDLYHRAEASVLQAWPLGVGDPPWPMVFAVSEKARQEARHLLPSACKKLVMFNIGTNQTVRFWPFGKEDRTWPVGNFLECAEALLDIEGIYFYLSAHSNRERRRAKQLVKALPVGKTIFPEDVLEVDVLAGLLQESACLVTCDTGILHLASSQKTPVVAIFGPRARPEITGPYLLGEPSRVFVSGNRENQIPASKISGKRVALAVRELLSKDGVEGVGRENDA